MINWLIHSVIPWIAGRVSVRPHQAPRGHCAQDPHPVRAQEHALQAGAGQQTGTINIFNLITGVGNIFERPSSFPFALLNWIEFYFIWFTFFLFYFILFILFYFILFYFILFYFIPAFSKSMYVFFVVKAGLRSRSVVNNSRRFCETIS